MFIIPLYQKNILVSAHLNDLRQRPNRNVDSSGHFGEMIMMVAARALAANKAFGHLLWRVTIRLSARCVRI